MPVELPQEILDRIKTARAEGDDHLYIGYCDLSDPVVVDFLVRIIQDRLQSLTSLDLWKTQVTDAGCEHLARLANLKKLYLWDTQVSDAGCEHLARLANLKKLYLWDTQVSDAGCEHLARLQSLTSLHLINTQVTDAGCEHLARLENLNELSLSYTQVSDAGCQHLARLENLNELSLSYTQVSDAGCQHLARLQSLTSLDLRHTQVSDAGCEHLARLQSLTSLDLRHTQVSDAGCQHLTRLANLKKLYLWDTQVSDAGCQHLARLANLKKLYLWDTQVSDAGCQHLARLQSLTSLDLRHTQVSDAGCEHLARLANLKKLYLWDTQVSDAGCQHLARLANLKELDLSETQVTDDGCLHLARLENLKELDLSETQVSDAGCEHLARLENLKELDLSETQVTDDGCLHLARLANLKELDLSETQVSAPDSLIGSRDARQIFQWIRELQKEGSGPLREVKILLVGQGEIGKTHLRNRLFKNPDYFNAGEPRTPDVEMIEEKLRDVEGTEWQCRLWDFGGQEYLHGSHRFFLRADHCLYVLVLDATRTARENRLDYWLRFLGQHSVSSQKDEENNPRCSPVLIVLSKCDAVELARRQGDEAVLKNYRDLQSGLERAAAKKWYGVQVWEDPIEGLGYSKDLEPPEFSREMRQQNRDTLDRILETIRTVLPEVPGAETPYPRSFHAMKQWLEEEFSETDDTEPKRWIDSSREPMQEKFRNAEATDPKTQQGYLSVLTSLGTGHWVGDQREVQASTNHLVKQGVFNPAWVKGPVYRLLKPLPADHPQPGWLQTQLLEERLELPDGEARDAILALTKACKIAFDVTGQHQLPEGLLIPDLLIPLPDEELENWTDDQTTTEELVVKFLPEAVFLRFIGANYQHLKGRRYCHRNEIVLSFPDQQTEVLVQSFIAPEHPQLPRLRISVTSANETERTYRLRQIQDQLHNILKSLDVELVSRDALSTSVASPESEATEFLVNGCEETVTVTHQKLILDLTNQILCYESVELEIGRGREKATPSIFRVFRQLIEKQGKPVSCQKLYESFNDRGDGVKVDDYEPNSHKSRVENYVNRVRTEILEPLGLTCRAECTGDFYKLLNGPFFEIIDE